MPSQDAAFAQSPSAAPSGGEGSVRSGGRERFGEAVLVLLPDRTSTGRRFTRDRADAEDLVAETVTKAWAHLPGLRDRARFRGWIFRILANTWISDCRARGQGLRSRHDPRDAGQAAAKRRGGAGAQRGAAGGHAIVMRAARPA